MANDITKYEFPSYLYQPAPAADSVATKSSLAPAVSDKLTQALNGLQMMSGLGAEQEIAVKEITESPSWQLYRIAAMISVPVSVYHGYKRNNSVGWAIWWGLMGSIAPVITPVIAYAQGFGKPREK